MNKTQYLQKYKWIIKCELDFLIDRIGEFVESNENRGKDIE